MGVLYISENVSSKKMHIYKLKSSMKLFIIKETTYKKIYIGELVNMIRIFV